MLWATRGRTWAFRFLRNDFDVEPLLAYDAGFDGFPADAEGCFRRRDLVALRFVDPEGRCDFAGRAILHEVVLSGSEAEAVTTLPRGVEFVWPIIGPDYELKWDASDPFDNLADE